MRFGRTPEGGSTHGRGIVAPPTPLLALTDHLLDGGHQRNMEMARLLSNTMADGLNTMAKTFALEGSNATTQAIRAHLEFDPICSQGCGGDDFVSFV